MPDTTPNNSEDAPKTYDDPTTEGEPGEPIETFEPVVPETSTVEEQVESEVQEAVEEAVRYGVFDPEHEIYVAFNGTSFRTIGAHSYTDEIFNLTVPDDFSCDLTTVPRLVRWFIPKMGRYTRGALYHDLLYRRPHICTRWVADSLFRTIMERDGVSWPIRATIFWAVRWWGWLAWMEKKNT